MDNLARERRSSVLCPCRQHSSIGLIPHFSFSSSILLSLSSSALIILPSLLFISLLWGLLFQLEQAINGSQDTNFLDEFLLCYRAFLSPTELLQELIYRLMIFPFFVKFSLILLQRYNPTTLQPDPATQDRRGKIIHFIRRWMGDHFMDSLDFDAVKVESFLSSIFNDSERKMLDKTFQIAREKATRTHSEVPHNFRISLFFAFLLPHCINHDAGGEGDSTLSKRGILSEDSSS